MTSSHKNLTEYEIPILPEEYNLTDGHVYRKWSSSENAIIDRSPLFFKQFNRQMQHELERNYVETFLNLAHQTIDFDRHKYLMCTSASQAFEVVANHLRLKGFSLCLIEPSFDNLADIFKRHNIPLEVFPDYYLDSAIIKDFLPSIKSDAICLISPNNPTGKAITESNFRELLKYCKVNNKLLILDTCFRAYLPQELIFDQYGLLIDSNIDYVVIEDTGKTWPTMEIKGAFMAVSNRLFAPIFHIHSDFLLHVSTFGIMLVTEFVKNSQKNSLSYIHEIVNLNRNCLYENIEGCGITPCEEPFASVSWLRTEKITGFELKSLLEKQKVFILPGNHFFWSDHSKGEMFIRISLTREPSVFSKAVQIIRDVCQQV